MTGLGLGRALARSVGFLCALALLAACETADCAGGGTVRGPDGTCVCRPGSVWDFDLQRCVALPDAGGACVADDDCDDGLYCNGAERCMPGAAGADANGCVAGMAIACAGTQACDEDEDRCRGGCAVPDADGDGHEDEDCGGDDCDDGDADRYPGNTEVCDAELHDEDCDPCTVGAPGTAADADGDGYVSETCANTFAGPLPMCEAMEVRVTSGVVRGLDCNDSSADIQPAQTEACNGFDDNCNGMVDEGAERTFHRDADGDGYGNPDGPTAMGCSPPAGYVEDATDCDDGTAARNPALSEMCLDMIDNDCDAMVDEGGMRTFYRDRDGDGRGDPLDTMASTACTPPAGSGYVLGAGDCNDANPSVYVSAPELCDGIDNDCGPLSGGAAGGAEIAEDRDGDGFAALDAPCSGGSIPRTDCDDTRPTARPGATEQCNGRDDDCDGTIDDGASAACSLPNATSVCMSGTCRVASCLGTFRDCTASAGCVTNTATSAAHCGGCGMACDVDACAASECAIVERVSVGGSPLPSFCAVRRGGRVVCWGDNRDGQLGIGSTTAVASPREVTLAPAIDVAVGGGRSPGDRSHACAVLADGRVACWGNNDQGQLGNGTTVGSTTPVFVTGITDAVGVAVGAATSCALLSSGVVRCWGANDVGQLGNGVRG